MEHRKLGRNGLQVSALGLGCMGMSFAYGPGDDEESLRVLHKYMELGGNFLDTAEIYGPYKNEELLGRFLREVPRDRGFSGSRAPGDTDDQRLHRCATNGSVHGRNCRRRRAN